MSAGVNRGPLSGKGHWNKQSAIIVGSRVSNWRNGPMLRKSRIYASPSSELEVKAIGPFTFSGSRLDSGACCHIKVHDRRAPLGHINSVQRVEKEQET